MNRIAVLKKMVRRLQEEARRAAEYEDRLKAANRELAWEGAKLRHARVGGSQKARS